MALKEGFLGNIFPHEFCHRVNKRAILWADLDPTPGIALPGGFF